MGVPQGSILAPMFFLLYVVDFNLCTDSLQHIAYANMRVWSNSTLAKKIFISQRE